MQKRMVLTYLFMTHFPFFRRDHLLNLSILMRRLVQNLYAPVPVVRTADGMVVVRTIQGEGDDKEEIFLRLKEGENIVDVVEEHKKGVHDILNLSDFSSMSLLNT